MLIQNGRQQTQAQARQTPRSGKRCPDAADTSPVTGSIRLAICFYATAARVHSGAGPSAGTRSKSAHPRQRVGRKRGQAKDGVLPREAPRFRATRGRGAPFCRWRALAPTRTAAEHSTGSAGSLVPVTNFHAANPQGVCSSASFNSPPQTSLTLHVITGDSCDRQETPTYL